MAVDHRSRVAYQLGRNDDFTGRVQGLCNAKAHELLDPQAAPAPSPQELEWAQSITLNLIACSDMARLIVAETDPDDVDVAVNAPDSTYQAAFDVVFPIAISTRHAKGMLSTDSPALAVPPA